MNVIENSEGDFRLSRGLINLQDRYPSSRIMDRRARNARSLLVEGQKIEFHHGMRTEPNRFSSRVKAKKLISASYFTTESLLLLIALTVTLLIVPLILPQLPPPPLLLLLVPIGILVVLMMLAFASPSLRDISHTNL